MYKNVIIIPALNPPENLIEYVKELINEGFERILLVDDGSKESIRYIFETLEKYEEVEIYRHYVNYGKGRALKNAFNYVLVKYANDIKGVITVDSDGQHSVEDVIKLHEELERQEKTAMILGTRDFDEPNVPPKSRYGNKVTSVVFRLLYGVQINDTQTGLRAIPVDYMKEYCDLPGERFEYEMNMLIYAAVHKHKMRPSIIQTIYFDNNSETHFRPILDSLKIYSVIFKGFFTYIFSSVSSSIIDLSLFQLLMILLGGEANSLKIAVSTIIARILSSIYNFNVNRKAVFKSTGNPLYQAFKYYALCILQMLSSAGLVAFVNNTIGGSALLEKVVIDSILFLISYQIQRVWVFGGKV